MSWLLWLICWCLRYCCVILLIIRQDWIVWSDCRWFLWLSSFIRLKTQVRWILRLNNILRRLFMWLCWCWRRRRGRISINYLLENTVVIDFVKLISAICFELNLGRLLKLYVVIQKRGLNFGCFCLNFRGGFRFYTLIVQSWSWHRERWWMSRLLGVLIWSWRTWWFGLILVRRMNLWGNRVLWLYICQKWYDFLVDLGNWLLGYSADQQNCNEYNFIHLYRTIFGLFAYISKISSCFDTRIWFKKFT